MRDGESSKTNKWTLAWLPVAAAVMLLVGLGVVDLPQRGSATLLGSTDSIERGRYSPWQVGDTHVHLVGDSGVLFNNRCRPNETTGLGDVMASLEDCAQRLIDSTHDIASHNGLDWVILTEHGPWLGSQQLSPCTVGFVQQVITVIGHGITQSGVDTARDSFKCIRHATTTYSYTTSVDAWSTIRARLAALPVDGPDLLLGQEIGTAAGISTLCARGITDLPLAARYGPGHVGVYSLGDSGLPLRNTIFDCDETTYLEWLEAEGMPGAINHPDNGDGGSDWHCWVDGDHHPNGDPCRRGVDSFTRTVLPIPIGAPVPPPAPVVGVAIVSDTKEPTRTTIANVLRQLRNGQVVGFVAGSDSHAITRERDFTQSDANDGKIGLAARTYAFAPPTSSNGSTSEPDALDHPARFALTSQATVASLGPLLSPQLEGVRPGGTAAVSGERARLVVSWPTANTWPHIHTGSGGYEITNDERVPRLNERPHRPLAIDVYVVAIGVDCATEDCIDEPTLRFDLDEASSETSAASDPWIDEHTDLDAGVLSADIVLPDSPTDRWAIVVRGRYGPDIRLAGDRTYPIDAWASPIWLDASSTRNDTATDDAAWFAPDADVPLKVEGPSSSGPSFSTADGAHLRSVVRVVDQRGNPVPNATVQLYRRDRGEIVPLAVRSGALATADRYRPGRTDDQGAYDVGLRPGRYLASASAALCTAAIEPTTSFDAGGTAAEPIVLDCIDPQALPITIRAVSAGGARTLDIQLACERPDGSTFALTQSIPADRPTELAQAPADTICTLRQEIGDGPTGTRLLADQTQTERVTLRGAEFVSYSTADIRPASFAIDARSLDPGDVGDAVSLLVWCPGFVSTRRIEVTLGERYIVDGMVDGDACAVVHLGDRLAFPPARVHEVHVVGTVEPEAGHEGHEHEHDAIFSVVDLLFTSGAVGPRAPLPDLGLPPVEVPTPGPLPPSGTQCEDTFDTDGDRCIRSVEPVPRIVSSDPQCRAGWTLASDGVTCNLTTTRREQPEITRRCPPGFSMINDVCGELIRSVPPTGDPTCPDGSQRVDTRCVRTWQQAPMCGEIMLAPGATCPVPLSCPAGGQLVTGPICAVTTVVPAAGISCPEGSTYEAGVCVLSQATLNTVDPIEEIRCPVPYQLQGDRTCTSTTTETELALEVSSIVLECPGEAVEEGFEDGVPICLEIRPPISD